MAFGLTHTPYIQNIIMEGDAQTPIKMAGKKSLPILQKLDGTYMNESGDIVKHIYAQSGLEYPKPTQHKKLAAWSEKAWRPVLNLTIPRDATADFAEISTPHAREAHTQRHVRVFGDFNLLLKNTAEYLRELQPLLEELDQLLLERESSLPKGSIEDVDYELYPLLRNLSIVKEVTFPKNVLQYMKNLENRSGVKLLH